MDVYTIAQTPDKHMFLRSFVLSLYISLFVCQAICEFKFQLLSDVQLLETSDIRLQCATKVFVQLIVNKAFH